MSRGLPGPGGRTKSGKPRPGTGGHGRRRLAGKGPTPSAESRPGHPAQRRAALRAAGTASTAKRIGPAGEATGGRPRFAERGAGSSAEHVAGRNAVLDALRAGVPASALLVAARSGTDERITEAVRRAADAGVPVVEAGRGELDRATGGAVHQGIALRVRPYAYAQPDDLLATGGMPLVVALDGVTDPRNLGAVVRSVAAFGGHGVLVPARRSAGVTAGAWKASAGALARVPVARTGGLARALTAYQRAGLFVVGLDATGPEDIGQLSLADSPLVLVAGAERRGLSRLVRQRCDAVARVPIVDTVESLNAGVAVGIALYAVSRRRER